MPAELRELTRYLDEVLQSEQYPDYCPNGLQVEGRSEVRFVIGGVTACQALLDRAVELSADAVLVHHGFFWKGESARVTGTKRRRLGALLRNDISLIAYHLPLDVHREFGNNACLGRVLGLRATGYISDGRVDGLIAEGDLVEPASASDFSDRIERALGRRPLHIGDPKRILRRVAWCTGAAQSLIERVAGRGIDAYLTGEVSEPTVHAAREWGIEFFSAGHHATERFGVMALGEHLAQRFTIEFHFEDIPNPV